MSTLRLSLRLQANQGAPGAARHALDGMELYVGDDRCDTIKLLVSELVTNSIRHADLADQDLIEVAVTATDETIRVEVTDPGPGFRHQAQAPAPEQESGWGLVLTDKLSERWGVADDAGTRVWFEIAPDPPVVTDELRSRRNRDART